MTAPSPGEQKKPARRVPTVVGQDLPRGSAGKNIVLAILVLVLAGVGLVGYNKWSAAQACKEACGEKTMFVDECHAECSAKHLTIP